MTATRQLAHPPGTLGLSLRAALPLVPGASRLPFVAGAGDEMPTEKLAYNRASFSPERLADYSHLCGFTVGNTLPPTAPHLLAFPLHLALMTDSGFPFPAVGLVHVRNRITVSRPIEATEPLRVAVHATAPEPHPRGRAFTLVTEVSAGGEPVWEERSTMLHRGNSNGVPDAAGARYGAGPDTRPELSESASWELPGGLGRRYATVSGDRNPIHLHPLGARLFGFPRAIAHGMWTKARCLAALTPTLPDGYSVEVAFRKPVLLPGRVTFAQASSEGRTDFEVRSARDPNRIHLVGTVSR